MDNLCHTLVGAAIGEAGLKHRTRYAQAALMIAANLPDVDVLVFATNLPVAASALWCLSRDRWPIGVSREGFITQLVQVQPRPKDASLVA